MLKLLWCEFAKLRRKPLFFAAAAVSALIPLGCALFLPDFQEFTSGAEAVDGMMSTLFQMSAYLLLMPALVVLASNLLFEEQDNDTLKNLMTVPVSKPALAKLGGAAFCYMADPAVAAAAKEAGTTRAVAAMKYAARQHPGAVFAVGNAPTALFALCDAMEAGDFRPALIIGVPVGFVNVVESKERLMSLCEKLGVPAIAAMGRKGGSSVAAAICNALLYTAAGQLDPAARGWQG